MSFNPLNLPPGDDTFRGREKDKSKWFTRWYVWVLPALVVIGVLLFAYA